MATPETHPLVRECWGEKAKKGLTLKSLSGLTKPCISPDALQRRFAGRPEFTVTEIEVVCDALGVPLSEMVRRAEAHRLAEVAS